MRPTQKWLKQWLCVRFNWIISACCYVTANNKFVSVHYHFYNGPWIVLKTKLFSLFFLILQISPSCLFQFRMKRQTFIDILIMTSWMEDQPFSRNLPTQDSTTQKNEDKHVSSMIWMHPVQITAHPPLLADFLMCPLVYVFCLLLSTFSWKHGLKHQWMCMRA
jgi:hypothetical protein